MANQNKDSLWGILHGDSYSVANDPKQLPKQSDFHTQSADKQKNPQSNANTKPNAQQNQPPKKTQSNTNTKPNAQQNQPPKKTQSNTNTKPNAQQNQPPKKPQSNTNTNPRSASPKRSVSDKAPQVHPNHPLSADDIKRQKYAHENYQFVKDHRDKISLRTRTIFDKDHEQIRLSLAAMKDKKSRFEDIIINNFSTISSAIYYHNHKYGKIYLLNFADAKNAGGGYLNGRNAQEECLCRQTLLYPTLKDNIMYKENQKVGPEGSDIMIYSPDVYVIRDDAYNMLSEKEQFKVDIISSAAVDNRHNIKNADKIMETRIRKIIYLAASESINDKDKNVLILGAFGCGVFKNDAKMISSIFAKVLNEEGMKKYFNLIVFPIFHGSNEITQTFQNTLKPVVHRKKP